jgi:hypothetical protein
MSRGHYRSLPRRPGDLVRPQRPRDHACRRRAKLPGRFDATLGTLMGAASNPGDRHGAFQTTPWQFHDPVNFAPTVNFELNVPLEGILPLTLIRLSPSRRALPW